MGEDSSEEVLVAAQLLMQLSIEDDDDDDNCGSNVVVAAENKKNKKLKKGHGGDRGDGGEEEEVDQKRYQIETSIWLKIEEIFGKDDEEEDFNSICRPKKRRFRSLQSIYITTKPIGNGRFPARGSSELEHGGDGGG
ncbi:hypothetical protein SDJN02_04148, partial [Cucurbita argyrosperma subsp. argyrosperma]